MAVISTSTDLNVVDKYTQLMKTSMESESFYARTKDTLQEYFEKNSVNNTTRSDILANVMGSMSSSLSAAAMSTALQWATNEVELALKKLEMEKQLDILDGQKELVDAQADKAASDNIATQAEVWRMYGRPTSQDGVLISLTDNCKLFWDTAAVEEQTTNLTKEGTILDSKLNESYAAIHKTVADTVVNYGPWTYSVGATGIASTPVRTVTSITPLSDVQRVIAQEQAKGYAYNAWANATTAAAGMIGTAVASDGAITEIQSLVTSVQTTINQLQGVTAPTFVGP